MYQKQTHDCMIDVHLKMFLHQNITKSAEKIAENQVKGKVGFCDDFSQVSQTAHWNGRHLVHEHWILSSSLFSGIETIQMGEITELDIRGIVTAQLDITWVGNDRKIPPPCDAYFTLSIANTVEIHGQLTLWTFTESFNPSLLESSKFYSSIFKSSYILE